jgi:hypothetical protein
MIDISSIKTDEFIIFCFELLSNNWKIVKKDRMDTIICSIGKNSIFEDYF